MKKLQKLLVLPVRLFPNLFTLASFLLPALVQVALVSYSPWFILLILAMYAVKYKEVMNVAVDPVLGVKVIVATGFNKAITGGFYSVPGVVYVPEEKFLYGNFILQHEVYHAKHYSTWMLQASAMALAVSVIHLPVVITVAMALLHTAYSRAVESNADEYGMKNCTYYTSFLEDMEKDLAKVVINVPVLSYLDNLLKIHPAIDVRMAKLKREVLFISYFEEEEHMEKVFPASNVDEAIQSVIFDQMKASLSC